MKTVNHVLAFLLELAMLAAWFWAGLKLPMPEPVPTLAAVLVPLFVIAVWGLFAAPKARFPLPVGGTVALKGFLLLGGALALGTTGQTLLAALDGVLVVANLTLAVVWGQFSRPDPLRSRLLALLDDYGHRHSEAATGRFREFVTSGEVLQGKANPRRHITASAWIVNPGRTRVLLTHHAKLGIWVQLGGHTDEGEDWAAAALREAREESGLGGLALVGTGLFDLDIHEIPARGASAAHDHYDLRFLVEADDTLPLTVSEESHDLAWVDLADLEAYTTEASQLRMRAKTPSRGAGR